MIPLSTAIAILFLVTLLGFAAAYGFGFKLAMWLVATGRAKPSDY